MTDDKNPFKLTVQAMVDRGEAVPQRPAEPAKKKRAARGTFDRTAYMREYMRGRRQKEKK
jgi:hypothetical protein